MIRSRRISRINAWLLLAILSMPALGLHGLSGTVLCIGADGHLTFETAVGFRCATDDAPSPEIEGKHEHRHVTDSATHCGDCVDVVITTGADEDCNAIAAVSSSAPSAPLVAMAIQSPRAGQRSGRVIDASIFARSSSNHISFLSTVVLLT